MAVLTITVDDTQVARVRSAYNVTTNAQLKTTIISEIKQRVVSYEINTAHALAEPGVLTAQSSVIQAGLDAKTSAEAISVT